MQSVSQLKPRTRSLARLTIFPISLTRVYQSDTCLFYSVSLSSTKVAVTDRLCTGHTAFIIRRHDDRLANFTLHSPLCLHTKTLSFWWYWSRTKWWPANSTRALIGRKLHGRGRWAEQLANPRLFIPARATDSCLPRATGVSVVTKKSVQYQPSQGVKGGVDLWALPIEVFNGCFDAP